MPEISRVHAARHGHNIQLGTVALEDHAIILAICVGRHKVTVDQVALFMGMLLFTIDAAVFWAGMHTLADLWSHPPLMHQPRHKLASLSLHVTASIHAPGCLNLDGSVGRDHSWTR